MPALPISRWSDCYPIITGIIPFSGLGVFPANLVSAQNLCTTERRGALDKG